MGGGGGVGIVPGMLQAKEIGVNLQPFVDFGPLAGGNLYLTLSQVANNYAPVKGNYAHSQLHCKATYTHFQIVLQE